MDQEQVQGLPEMWAVVELFGHQRVTGKLSTQTLGAACLLRVDIPEYSRRRQMVDPITRDYVYRDETVPAFTRFLGII